MTYQEHIFISRSLDGQDTTIRLGSRMDDHECKCCGQRFEGLHLNEIWIPTALEGALIQALQIPEREEMPEGHEYTRVILNIVSAGTGSGTPDQIDHAKP